MMTAMAVSDEAAIARTAALFDAPAAAIEPIARDLTRQMARGLVGEPSSLKMLRTFTRQPSGRERGRVMVVDWGGTKARAGLIELGGDGAVRMVAEEALTFSDADKRGAPEPVFDLIAQAVGRVARAQEVVAAPLAFIYSYPARLERIDRAVALASTKGWRLEGLVGQDVAGLLGAALRRTGLERIAVAAVANDTVATLMLQSYQARGRDAGARPADLGLILGTGTNLAADLGPAGIRNLESGNFDGVGGVETPYDAALDRELDEPAPGAQRFEKMVSGHYLGEILRRALRDLGTRAARDHWMAPSALATPFALDSAHLSRIAADRTGGLDDVGALLRALGVPSTREERHEVRALGAAVARRAARLVGAALVGTLRFLDAELADRRTIAVDGSLWGGYPGFEALVRETLVELVGGERASRIETAYVKDSTSAGAAVIAAVADTQRSEGCSSA
jgi:hexokinase